METFKGGAGPHDRTMESYHRMEQLAKAKGLAQGQDEAEAPVGKERLDIDGLEHVRNTWNQESELDLPDCSILGQRSEIIAAPLKVDLGTPEQRELFASKVTEAIEEGETATGALQKAARARKPAPRSQDVPLRPKQKAKKRRRDEEDVEGRQCDELIDACLSENMGEMKENTRGLLKTISIEHEQRLHLGLMQAGDHIELCRIAEEWWTKKSYRRQLDAEVRREKDRRKRRALAAERWENDQSGAYADMTKPRATPASCSLQTIRSR